MRTLKVTAFALALFLGGLVAVPEAQTTIKRGFAMAFFGDGSAAAPSMSFSSQSGTGWFYGGDGKMGLGLGSGTTPMVLFGGTTSSFPALKRSAAVLQARLADDSAFANVEANFVTGSSGFKTGSTTLVVSVVPTIGSGFGTTPTIPSGASTAAFTVNVGTGGTATSGVITLLAATTGWNCFVNDITAAAAHVAYNTVQTASTTTSVTLENQTKSTGAAVAWAASDILRVSCFAY